MITSKTNPKDIKNIKKGRFLASTPSPLQQLYKGSQAKQKKTTPQNSLS